MLPLSPPLAAGLVLIAACPAGAPFNLLARLTRADVAPSVTLTALAAPAAAIIIPLSFRLAAYRASNDGLVHRGLLRTGLGVAVLAVPPVLPGVAIRMTAPAPTRRIERPALRPAAVAFVVGLVAAVGSTWHEIPGSALEAGPAAGGRARRRMKVAHPQYD